MLDEYLIVRDYARLIFDFLGGTLFGSGLDSLQSRIIRGHDLAI